MSARGRIIRRSCAAVAALAPVGTALVGCGGDDDGGFSPLGSDPESGSVTALMASAAHSDSDDVQMARHFSVERFRAGADLDEDLEGDDLVEEVFLEEEADLALASPYDELLKLSREEPGVLPLADVRATYEDLGEDGSLLVGDFDAATVGDALSEVVGAVEEEAVGDVTVYRPAEDDDEDIPAEGDGGPDSIVSRLYGRGPIAVSDDGTEVVFGTEGDGLDALAMDEEDSAFAVPGMADVAAALDDAGVSAAWIFFDVQDITDEGPVEASWPRGAVATGLAEDGDPVAYSVLWHDDEADAEANVDPLADAMDDTDRCHDPATAEADGHLVVASCPYDGRWANDVLSRFPIGPLFS